jgi:hypothetical protein
MSKYRKAVTRANPGLNILTIDCSSSMGETAAKDPTRPKAQMAESETNRFIRELVVSCTNGNEVRDYLYFGAIRYSENVQPESLLSIQGGPLHPISEVARAITNPETEKFVTVAPNGNTPMGETLESIKASVKDFCDSHADSPPPVVLNVSDGAPTGKDVVAPAQDLMALGTNDGNVLVFNYHTASRISQVIRFPASKAECLGDKEAETLFDISSLLPPNFVERAAGRGIRLAPGARGLIVNGDASDLRMFLEIGSVRPSQKPMPVAAVT